jgi:hypothetical protein
MTTQLRKWSASALAALAGFGLALAANIAAAVGKPPPAPPPASPDIVYMSDEGKMAVWQAAVRGSALSADQKSAADSSLLSSTAGRVYTSVTWSPDGKRFAWIEISNSMRGSSASILAASPGGRPVPIYTYTTGDNKPALTHNPDALAWGRDCAGTGSVLAFLSASPIGVYGIRFTGDVPSSTPVQLADLQDPQYSLAPHAFAFSPTGRNLVFFAGTPALTDGIQLLSMCPTPATPTTLVPMSKLAAGSVQVTSIDWSRDGARLALSMYIYPNEWRDMKVVELDYSLVGSAEQVLGFTSIVPIDLGTVFGAASSEHSPSWGPPTNSSGGCQRFAFSRSTDLGRSLYLLDYPATAGAICEIPMSAPRLISSKYPRAIDWR